MNWFQIWRKNKKTRFYCFISVVSQLVQEKKKRKRPTLRYQFAKSNIRNTLWKWNVIMYANVTLPLTLVSNKLNVQFFSVLFQWEKFRRALWKLVSKKGAKIQEKDAWLFCGRVSASLNAKPLPDFSFPNSRFSTEKVVAFICEGTCVC